MQHIFNLESLYLEEVFKLLFQIHAYSTFFKDIAMNFYFVYNFFLGRLLAFMNVDGLQI